MPRYNPEIMEAANMTKEEMIAFLKERDIKAGMQYGEDTLREMVLAEMEKKSPPAAEKEGLHDETDEPKVKDIAPPAAPEPKVSGSFGVMRGGEIVRTYTQALHRENAQAYATEYAQKIGGKVVSS